MTRIRWSQLSFARDNFALAFYESKYKPGLREVGMCLVRGPGDSSYKTGALSAERTRQLIIRALIQKEELNEQRI